MFCWLFFEGLLEIGDDVGDILNSDRETDQVGGNSSFAELIVGELAVGVACGMEHTSSGIGHMGDNRDEFKGVHKLDCVLARAFEAERNNATSAVWHLFFCEFVIFAAFESGIVYPADFRVGFQPFGHGERIFAVTRHSEMESFESDVEQEAIVRGWD